MVPTLPPRPRPRVQAGPERDRGFSPRKQFTSLKPVNGLMRLAAAASDAKVHFHPANTQEHVRRSAHRRPKGGRGPGVQAC